MYITQSTINAGDCVFKVTHKILWTTISVSYTNTQSALKQKNLLYWPKWHSSKPCIHIHTKTINIKLK